MRRLAMVLILAATAGCASTFGPGPVDRNYDSAMRAMEIQDQVEYAEGGTWWPDVMLGSINSFHSASIPGRVFLTNEQLIFAVYDAATDTFLEGFSLLYTDITWVTKKPHGLSSILRIQSGNQIDSFIIFGTNRSAASDYVLAKVN